MPRSGPGWSRGGGARELAAREAVFEQELAAQRGKTILATFAERAIGWTDDLIERTHGSHCPPRA
jgi:hypothetical protein